MKKYILLFLIFTATLNIYSQITTNEQPISLSLRSIDHGLEKELMINRPISLPIPDMKKVYADSSLPYTQDDQFDLPAEFDPCSREDDMELANEAEEDEQLINQIFE